MRLLSLTLIPLIASTSACALAPEMEALCACATSPLYGPPDAWAFAALKGDLDTVAGRDDAPAADKNYYQASLLHFAAVGTQPETVEWLLADRANPFVLAQYPMSMAQREKTPDYQRQKTPREALIACEAVDKTTPAYAAVIKLLEDAEQAVRDRGARAEAALSDADFDSLLEILEEGLVEHPVAEKIASAAVKADEADFLRTGFERDLLSPPRGIYHEVTKQSADDHTAAEQVLVDRWHAWEARMIRGQAEIAGEAFQERVNRLQGDRTPLMEACAGCNAEVVAALLDAGADPRQKNEAGNTAADFICTEYAGNDGEAIRALLGRQRAMMMRWGLLTGLAFVASGFVLWPPDSCCGVIVLPPDWLNTAQRTTP